jgi:DNA-directed RNA polymerase specialized sigma24 family protein
MSELFADEPQAYADVARATGIPIGSLGPTRRRILQRVRRALDAPLGV